MRTDLFTTAYRDDEGTPRVNVETDSTGTLLDLTADEAEDFGHRLIARANEARATEED